MVVSHFDTCLIFAGRVKSLPSAYESDYLWVNSWLIYNCFILLLPVPGAAVFKFLINRIMMSLLFHQCSTPAGYLIHKLETSTSDTHASLLSWTVCADKKSVFFRAVQKGFDSSHVFMVRFHLPNETKVWFHVVSSKNIWPTDIWSTDISLTDIWPTQCLVDKVMAFYFVDHQLVTSFF